MSEAGRYTKLPHLGAAWQAEDRRDPDPVNGLGRRLDAVCRAAVDPFEVAAYLESVGYNRYRVQREFGLDNAFDLARHLYDRVPRRAVTERPAKSDAVLWQRHLAVLATFVTTLALQAGAAPTGFDTVLWLIVWSVVGSGVVGNLNTEPDRRQQSVVGALFGVGALGLLLSLPLHGFSWTELTVSLLWWHLTGQLWWAQVREGRLLPGLLPVLGVGGVLGATLLGAPLPVWSAAAVALASSLLTLFQPALFQSVLAQNVLAQNVLAWRTLSLSTRSRSTRSRSTRSRSTRSWPDVSLLPGTWRYLVTPPRRLTLLALYGGGQGVLLVRLLHDTEHLLLGTALLAAVVLALEGAARALVRVLARTLWASAARHVYQRRARRAATLWLLLLLLPVGFVTLQEGRVLDTAALYGFLLLGLGLGLGLTLLNLGNLGLPSLAFAGAALAVGLGLPLVGALVGLVVLLALGLLVHLRALESYGVQVL